jgi:hypothetical protein
MKIPIRYVPTTLTKKDQKKQFNMILKSKKLYKKKQYYTRKKVSYPHQTSKHILRARKIYHVEKIIPNQELALKTGCPLSTLKKIVNKGEGAYYSSGSRPNQTPQSWGLARLASAITGGKASMVDYDLIQQCDHQKKAYKLAKHENIDKEYHKV